MIDVKNLPVNVLGRSDEMTREQWLELRMKGMGGSEAGAVVGLSKWGSPLTVYLRKKGMLPEVEDNEDMEFGREAEPFIRDWFARKLGAELGVPVIAYPFPWVMQSKKYPWMLANIDGIVEVDGWRYLLEIKTAGSFAVKEWKEDIPAYYQAQVQHYATVTGIQRSYVVCLVGKKLIWHVQEHDPKFADEIIESERLLWEMIQDGEMPAPIGIEAEAEALCLGDVDPDKFIEDDSLIADEYAQVNEQLKYLEAQKTKLKTQLLYLMGDAKTLLTPSHKVLHLQSDREYFDKKSFQKEHPDIYTRYTEKRKTDMGLRLYAIGEKK